MPNLTGMENMQNKTAFYLDEDDEIYEAYGKLTNSYPYRDYTCYTRECGIHPVYKEKILKAGDLCTMVTGKRLGHPVRSLRTKFAREYFEAEYSGASEEALEAMASGALRLAAQEGDETRGCFLAGQIASMVKKEQSAAQIIEEVTGEAEPILLRASQWVK